MKVRCNAVGSVPTRSNAIKTECNMCGAAQVHDDTNCLEEPCPWNKNARCVPVDVPSEDHSYISNLGKPALTVKDLKDADEARAQRK